MDLDNLQLQVCLVVDIDIVLARIFVIVSKSIRRDIGQGKHMISNAVHMIDL